MTQEFQLRRMVRIREARERLVVDLPFLREHRAQFFSDLSLPVQSLHFEVRLGESQLASGVLDGEAQFEVTLKGVPAGALTVRLLAGKPKEREVWKQLVFVQPNLTRTPEEVDALARRYAPILLFSRKEEYFPVSLGGLLRAPELLDSKQSIVVETIFGKQSVPLGSLSEFLRYNGHCEYLLDQSVLGLHGSDFKKIHGSATESVVYYSYMEDPENNRFFINYHTFYAFDPKTGIARLFNIGPHIFDRESMSITFNANEEPAAIVLSGHMENQTISFFDRLIAWSSGRVTYEARHPRAPQVMGHPVVPVAEGSHALYPAAGRYRISVLTELAGHIMGRFLPQEVEEGEPAELEEQQVLLPPAFSSNRHACYDLRPLRFDRLQSEPGPAGALYDPDSAVLVFSGYWVDVPGTHNERFPPFSRKECEIADWVDRAFHWNWDSLPDDVARHTEAITEAIAKSIQT